VEAHRYASDSADSSRNYSPFPAPPARRSHRNGQSDPSGPRRKILTANNARESEGRELPLTPGTSKAKKRMNAREKWNFGESLPSARCRWLGQLLALLVLLALLSFRPVSPPQPGVFRQPRSPLLFSPAEMDMFSRAERPSSLISPFDRPNETTRYYYAAADPCKQ